LVAKTRGGLTFEEIQRGIASALENLPALRLMGVRAQGIVSEEFRADHMAEAFLNALA
jgi:hypothetical protein